MITEKEMPDLSGLNKAVPHFLVSSLAGFVQKKGLEFNKAMAVAVRLIDKAQYEYQLAREAVGEEERERNMTYEEILKRDEGQYMYTTSIMNHLENCLNAVARLNKLMPLLGSANTSSHANDIRLVRNTLEHIEERIADAVQGPVALNFYNHDFMLEIGDQSISVVDLANEITRLNTEIHSLLAT